MKAPIKTVSKQINKNTIATILPTNVETNLSHTIWAINWFDLKYGWIYKLYNMVVVKYVRQVGGQPLFKGKLYQVIRENSSLMRSIILIVSYPNANAFLTMLSIRAFQLKSVLRLMSVDHFIFGFHKRLDNGNLLPENKTPITHQLKYMVIVTTTAIDNLQASQLKEAASKKDIFTHFIGSKTALLGVEKDGKGMQTIPFPITHVLIFSAFETAQFDGLIENPSLSLLTADTADTFIGLYDLVK